MFGSKKNIMEYWTDVPGLTAIEESCPSRYLDVMPTWWKNIPIQKDFNTSKDCPSFIEVFKSAYVLRMWCDFEIITVDDNVFWKKSSDMFSADIHQNQQFIDFLPSHAKDQYSCVVKPMSPWYLKTPKGYSIYQMPVTYDFNNNFTALPGIIHTDQYHIINPQLLINKNVEKIIIKRGTPLAIHFPFKREKFSLLNREKRKEDDFLVGKSILLSVSKFKNSYRGYTKGFM